jgi:hypothetical protein
MQKRLKLKDSKNRVRFRDVENQQKVFKPFAHHPHYANGAPCCGISAAARQM